MGPLVSPTQLLATMRSTSAKHNVTITKNGPRSRNVTAPIARPKTAAMMVDARMVKWNGVPNRTDSSAAV